MLAPCKNKLRISLTALAAVFAALTGAFFAAHVAYAQGGDNDYVDVALILEAPDSIGSDKVGLNIVVVNHGSLTAYDVEVVVDIVYPESSSHFDTFNDFLAAPEVPVGSSSLENSKYRLRWSIPELGGLQREEVAVESRIMQTTGSTFDKSAYIHEFFGTVTTSSFDSNPGNNTSRVWSVPYLALRLRSFIGAGGNYTVAVTVDELSPSQGDTVNFTITTGKLGTDKLGESVSLPIDLQVAIELTGGLRVSGAPSYTSTTFEGDPVTKPSSVSYDSGVFTVGRLQQGPDPPYPKFHSVTLPITVASDAVVNEQCLTATLTGNPPPGTGPNDDDIADNVAKVCLSEVGTLARPFVSGQVDAFTVYPCVGVTTPPCDSTNDVRVRAVNTSNGGILAPGTAIFHVNPTEARIYDAKSGQSVNDGNTVSWQTAVNPDRPYNDGLSSGIELYYSRTPFTGHESDWKRPTFGISARNATGNIPPPGKVFLRSTSSGNEFRKAVSPDYQELPGTPSTSAMTASRFHYFLEFEKLGTYKIGWHVKLTRNPPATLHGSENCHPSSADPPVNQAFCASETYTFHLGPMADLEVRDGGASPYVAADRNALAIVAVNNGPDEPAGGARVTGLPIGAQVLHISHGRYNGSTGVWSINRLRVKGYYLSAGMSEPTLVLGASAGDTADVSISSAENYEVCVGPKSNPGNLAHTTQATCEAVTNASWNSVPVYDYKPGDNTVTITAQVGTGGGESAPSSMSARQYGAATYVTWEPVERVYGLPVAHYEVERNGVILTDKPKGTTYLDSIGSGSASYRVRAVNAAENPGPWSEASARRPGIPKNFSATVYVPNTEIDLSWGAPDAVTGVDITGYDLEFSTDGGANWTALSNQAATAISFDHTGQTLTPGATWKYRLRTLGNDGGVVVMSGWATADAAIPYPAPVDFAATAVSDTKATLSWSAPSGVSHTGYEFGFSKDGGNTWESLASQAATATTFTHTHGELEAGETRQYRARTVGSVSGVVVMSGWAFATAVRDYPEPGAPTSFEATGDSATQATLTWSAPTDLDGTTLSGYDLEFSTDGGSRWTSLAADRTGTTFTTRTSYTHTYTNLAADDVRQYRVRTVGTKDGETFKSVWAYAKASEDYPAPGAPRNFTAAAVSDTAVSLSWTQPDAVQDVTVTGYNLQVSIGGGEWTSLLTGHSGLSHTHDDAANPLSSKSRRYRLQAVGTVGTSSYESGWVFAVPAEEVGQPQNLTATADGKTRIDLTWAPPAVGADAVTGYRIDYTPATPEQWQTLEHNYRTSPRRYEHTGLSPGQEYCYRVAAIYAGGTGPFAARACATTEGAPTDLPGEPENLRFARVGSNFVELEWDPPSVGGTVAYYEYRHNFLDDPVEVTPRGATRVRVGGLTPFWTYDFEVRGRNSLGPGEWAWSGHVTLNQAGEVIVASPQDLEIEKGGTGSFNLRLKRSPKWPLRLYFTWEGPDCLTESLPYQQGKILLPTNPPPSRGFWEFDNGWWGPPEDRFARQWNAGLDVKMDASGCQGGEMAVVKSDLWTVPFSYLEGLPMWDELNLNEEEWREKWGADPLDGISGPSVTVRVTDDGVGGQQGGDPGDSAGDAGPPTAVSLSLDAATVGESAGQVTVTATLNGPAPEGGIGGFLSAGEDSTASEDIDFTMPLGIFIPGGQRSATATVSITDDDLDEADETVVMSALFDIGTALLEDKITLTITDDDTAGVTVNAASPLVVDEGGTAGYTVVLGSHPAADVTVTPTSGDPGAASVSPASHTFTPSGWNTPLTFMVSGVADTDTVDESVSISHGLTSADAQYAVLSISTVSVSVTDTTQQQPPSNQAPTVSSAIADATIVNESGTREVSLSGVFSDTDNDALTITADSSNDAVTTVSVAADYSTLTVNAQSRGTATVTVTADDGNGGTVEDAFTVTVKAAPVVASAIADMSLVAGDTRDVTLSVVFSDPDGDALSFTAASTDPDVVNAILFQGTLTIIGATDGAETITVTAQDSDGNTVSDAFDVSVSRPEVDHGEPTPVSDLRCVAKTDQVAFLWDEPEWSGGEVYAYDYDLTLPNGERKQSRLIGFDFPLVRHQGDYQVGTETSVSVEVVYELPDGSEVSSAAATLACTVAE